MKTLHIDSVLTRGSLNVSLLARLVSVVDRIPAGFRSQSHPSATSGKLLSGLLLLCALWLPGRALGVGTWTPLANQPVQPAALAGIANCTLLSDGTILAAGLDSHWFKLTPDSHGHYINGTWSALNSYTYYHTAGSAPCPSS